MSTAVYTSSSPETLGAYIEGLTEPAWLTGIRRDALERFSRLPWPSARDEEFRRTDLSSFDFESWGFSRGEGSPAPEGAAPAAGSAPGEIAFEGASLAGRYLDPELAGKGCLLLSFDEIAAGALPEKVARSVAAALRKGLDRADNRLALWHYVTMTHGAVLYVPPFLELQEPFRVTFNETASGGAQGASEIMRAPQVVVIADEGARFSLLHQSDTDVSGEILFNEGIILDLARGSKVDYFLFQDVNIDSSFFSNSYASVGSDATLRVYSAVFGGLLSKYRMEGEMAGPGGDAFFGGIYFPHQDQHVDLRTVQDHRAPKAHSLALYKGAVADEARSVFQGLIKVDHDALDTDAYLTNNNLVLGDEAEADSIPMLEINTDQVRCSHGSTTGKLDARQLFYLETRGYTPKESRRILIEGFFAEVSASFPREARERIEAIVDSRIPVEDESNGAMA
ncbi:SufB/SufD family protein [Alkalispirochaeta alkalica]|uniref:SufB/SufD family protein n=1 Tax=Alkalispirochaeta alkalica TaxID=46356 RepID=UPI000371F499|nr:SufD family Fe-S cluster assembly protein [Alkalispirochaeta alkalica]